MRQILVFAHLNPLGVHHDKLKILRTVSHDEGHDQSVHEDGLAASGRAGYEHMWEIAEVGGNVFAADRFAKRNEHVALLTDWEVLNHLIKGNDGRRLVGDFEAGR